MGDESDSYLTSRHCCQLKSTTLRSYFDSRATDFEQSIYPTTINNQNNKLFLRTLRSYFVSRATYS
jgi:hypothetical protein